MKRSLKIQLSCAAIWIALCGSPASAALQVDVLDANIQVGGSGFVDVMISGASDLVNGHQLELLITPQAGVLSVLQFASSQTFNYSSDGSYIYAGDSANEAAGAPFPKDVLNPVAGPSFLDTDTTNSGLDVSVGATPFLLARLNIEHIVPGATDPNLVVGNQFDIDVVVGGAFGTTFSNSSAGSPTFTSSSGTVTVTDAAAIPEPGVLIMVGAGLSAVFYRRRKQAA